MGTYFSRICTAACCWFAISAAAQPAKLAVVGVTDELIPAVDVLTAILSSSDDVILLERTEVSRVWKEQSLTGAAVSYGRLGQALDADGLLLLELVRVENHRALRARLIAVRTGVALRQHTYRWPLENASDWSAGAARQFLPLASKLLIKPEHAVPLSLLNLRSATQSPEGKSLEYELTQLLHDRLMQETNILVLERRRLETAFEETQWFAPADSSLLSSSYVLDGTIDQKGYVTRQATISARLVRPGGAESPIEVTGSRTNLVALTEALTAKILGVMQIGHSTSTWRPEEEAASYLAEAKWTFKWGLMREAQSASETSWALGLQTREVAELRVKAWRETGYDRASGVGNMEKSHVGFGWPDANQFADLRRAADAYEQGWKHFVANDPKLDPTWLDLGNTLLGDLTQWLKHYYYTPEAREGQQEAIAQAKQQASRLCASILAHPGYANTDTNKVIWLTKARGAAFWVDTPEEGVAIYREMMKRGMWPSVRRRFVGCIAFQQESGSRLVGGGFESGFDLSSPPLAGWTWANRSRWKTVWDQFINELCAAEDPLTSLEGRYLRCSSAWSAEAFEASARDLLDFVWNSRNSISTTGLEPALSQDLKQLAGPSAYRIKYLNSDRAARMQTNVWGVFEKQMTDLEQLRDALRFFALQPNWDAMALSRWKNTSWTKEQAKELLPAVSQYKSRVMASQLPFQQKQLESWVGQFETQLNSIVSPPPPNPAPTSTAAMASANPTNRPSQRAANWPSDYDLARQAATNKINSIRFWSPQPAGLLSLDEISDFNLSDMLLREGRIWIEAAFISGGDFGQSVQRVLCAVDLKTMTSEFIPLGERVPWVFPKMGRLEQTTFEIYQGSVYRAVGNQLTRYSLSGKKWETLTIPIQPPARLSVVHDKLYLTTSESILELDTAGNTKVLASTRRRPALTPLDPLDGLGAPLLFRGDDKTVRALIGSQFWSSTVSNSDWKVLFEEPRANLPRFYPDGTVLFQAGKLGGQLFSLCPDVNQPEMILPQPFPPTMRPPFQRDTKWQLPFGISATKHSPCLDGTNLWIFADTMRLRWDSARGMNKGKDEPDGLLFGSAPGDAWSVFPVTLNLPDLPLVKSVSAVQHGPFDETLLRSTPDGLVLLHFRTPGFWLIPRSAMNEALTKR
jgi:hypothetical protein